MNKENQCFILVKDWAPLVFRMTEEEKAAILTGLFKEATGDPDYHIPPTVRGVFDFFLAQIEKNDEKWAESRQRRREAGKKGGEAKANNTKQPEAMPSNAKQSQATLGNAKHNVNVNVNENVNVSSIEDIKKRDAKASQKKAPTKSSPARFIPPSVEDVRAYCLERNNRVDAEGFVSFYESNGWRVGKNPMKDWKAAVRTWEKRTNELHANALSTVQPKKSDDFVDLDAMRADPKYAFIFANERRGADV